MSAVDSTGPRVLHASLMSRVSPGKSNQLLLEHQAAVDLGIPWNTVVMAPERERTTELNPILRTSPSVETVDATSLTQRTKAFWALRRDFYGWLRDSQSDFDMLLIRYSVHDPMLVKFLRDCRIPVATVHHTLEVEELPVMDGLVGRSRSSAERVIGPWALRRTSAIVGVTSEIAEYEVGRIGSPAHSRLVYPNGGPDQPCPVDDRRGSLPEFLFVASDFTPWQGLDILLESLGQSDQEFIVHVVGQVAAADQNRAAVDHRVVLHGVLSKVEIREIAASCWAAISTLGLARKGMLEACPLKVRDYLSMGLPTFGAYKDVFPEEFPYFGQGQPSIYAALDFAKLHREADRTVVAEAAQPFISKEKILVSLHRQLGLVAS